MFFDSLEQIPQIATHTSCTIFVVDPNTKLKLKNALTLTPSDDKKTTVIGVDQIREFIAITNSKETADRFFIITPADAMNEAAQNAFLKTFEEPKPYCHFVLLTAQPSALLPTILSRAQIFFPKATGVLNAAPTASDKILNVAKQLIAAQPANLPVIASDLAKVKTKPRENAMQIVATSIELLYKSYFKTKNPKFLSKIPNFITLYDNLAKNGHLKLHLVADLL